MVLLGMLCKRWKSCCASEKGEGKYFFHLRVNSKFRMEMEKTWDLERRLKTWASRDKNFNSKNNAPEQKIGVQTLDTIRQNLDTTGLYVPSQLKNQ
jgi:hypothetical protein